MEIRQAVDQLSDFVRAMTGAGVRSKKDFNSWKKKPKTLQLMEQQFAYEQKKGMPAINSLVTVDFNQEIPVLLLNYTQVAHNTLHEYPEGWTRPLRQCRGIVFDYEGYLVAKPFEKFFNNGEHPETKQLPAGPFESPQKKDGHLGIIFKFKGKIHITTRGSFNSPTVKIANAMLADYVKKGDWHERYNPQETVLVEIIHPQTKVLTDYNDFKDFILIGCINRQTLEDYDLSRLHTRSEILELPMVRTDQFDSIEDLQTHIQDRSIKNQEGYVIRFSNGLRVKYKFESYIGQMVAEKLSYKYLMNRIISGSVEKMIATLPEEIYQTALQMLGQLYLIMLQNIEPKQKWQKLYELVPEEDRSDYYKGICRQFVKANIK